MRINNPNYKTQIKSHYNDFLKSINPKSPSELGTPEEINVKLRELIDFYILKYKITENELEKIIYN